MSFEYINDLTLTGKGTFNSQGAAIWEYNDCKTNKDCQKLPANASFHSLTITAPDESLNTDGMHISNSSFISVTNIMIETGDDCISIRDRTTNLTVSQVTCRLGHGISLGKYPNEDDVSEIVMIHCTFQTLQMDIIINHVKNPIIIDQKCDIKDKEAQPSDSKVKVSDVHFRNIKGTSISVVAVDLQCSSAFPYEGVELSYTKLTYIGNKPSTESASCSNAKVTCAQNKIQQLLALNVYIYLDCFYLHFNFQF
ncbi:hypothetical protein JCGZ_10302 [Jatropha curcas]|uniref:Polygalacturonase n=1 Tax=Jatropha curcas TaxID=180498 RepID=A0A067KJ65_JATCU|nr:hypothetical protein JCGZ_10302 [Jatropha curcas]